MDVSGFVLTVVGMGVVFSALALLAITAWVLERVFRKTEQDEIPEGKERKEKIEKLGDMKGEKIGKEGDIKAIIALALAYHTKKKGIIHIHGTNESLWMQQTRRFE